MQHLNALTVALESQYLGKIVMHNYGQLGFGVVTGIDTTNPQKPRLRVKFTRQNTPSHIKTYDNRENRVRSLLPQSVTISKGVYQSYNFSNTIKK